MLTSKLFETPDPAKTLNFQVGVASPLWGLYAGVTGAGMAYYWWLSRWREVTNLEAVLAPVEPDAAPEPVEPVIEAAPEPVVEAAPEPVIETAPEPVLEAAPAPAPEPVAEPAPEAPAPASKKPKAKPAAEA